jgi:hypothetical protein
MKTSAEQSMKRYARRMSLQERRLRAGQVATDIIRLPVTSRDATDIVLRAFDVETHHCLIEALAVVTEAFEDGAPDAALRRLESYVKRQTRAHQ